MNGEITQSRISRATFWSVSGEILAKIAAPISNMILARILAPEVFGIIATVNMVVSLSDIFTEAGFQLYIVQHEFKNKEELRSYSSTAYTVSLLIGLLMFGAIAIFRNSIADYVGSPEYGFEIMIASLSIPLTSVISILQCSYRRELNYKPLFIRRIAVLMTPFFVTVPLALIGWGCWSLVIGTLASKVVNVMVLLWHSSWKPILQISMQQLKEMFPFCITTMVSYLASWLTNWIDIFIISNILGAYYTGLYKNSQATVTGMITIVTASLTPILFSVLCRYQDNHKKFCKTMEEFTHKLSLFLLPIGGGILIYRDLVTKIMLGKQWSEASTLIGVWGVATILSAVYATYCREACRAKGKPYLNVIAQILSLCVIIPSSYFGANAGYQTLIYIRSAAVLSLILFYYLILFLKLRINPINLIKATLSPWFCTLIMMLIVWILKMKSINVITDFLIIGCGVLVYFNTAMLFNENRKILLGSIKTILNKLKNKN